MKRRVHRVPKRRPRPPQPKGQARDLNAAPLDLSRQTYLSIGHAMQYLDFEGSRHAFYVWLSRHKVPRFHAGGLKMRRRDLDQAVQKTGQASV
jgi:hypothetical protein